MSRGERRHLVAMLIAALLLVQGATAARLPCRLADARSLTMVPAHRALRTDMGVAMPTASTMVLIYGSGGHHVTRTYSVIVARGADGVWRGSTVGRDVSWPDRSTAMPLPDYEWTVDAADGKKLDAALTRPCATIELVPAPLGLAVPPPLGAIGEHIDVLIDGRIVSSGAVGEQGEALSALIRGR